jgi:hypothetical protein
MCPSKPHKKRSKKFIKSCLSPHENFINWHLSSKVMLELNMFSNVQSNYSISNFKSLNFNNNLQDMFKLILWRYNFAKSLNFNNSYLLKIKS